MGIEAFEVPGGAAGPWELCRSWENLLCLEKAAGRACVGRQHLERDSIRLGRATTFAMTSREVSV